MVQHFPQPVLSACTVVVAFFLPVAKHCQSTFFSSLNPFKIHLDANYVCPSVKNLTLSTCLLSFVCDFLNIEKVHNILIFAKFPSYSVGEMLGGGGGYFLGISTLKQTLTLVILPCEILSKSDLIYQNRMLQTRKTEQFQCIYLLNCLPFVSKMWEIFFAVFRRNLLQLLLTTYCYRKSPERNSLEGNHFQLRLLSY